VTVRQLVEDFATYIYLPRLTMPEVLIAAIQDGIASLTWVTETFAYAERYDEQTQRYVGLRAGERITLTVDDAGVIVKPDIARRQLDADAQAARPAEVVQRDLPPTTHPLPSHPTPLPSDSPPPPRPAPSPPQRFYGSVRLDPNRVGRDAGRIAEEVIAHLIGQLGTEVTVTLDIEARSPKGFPDQIVRIVLENGRTLKFTTCEFDA
jgi:hypothetical protein